MEFCLLKTNPVFNVFHQVSIFTSLFNKIRHCKNRKMHPWSFRKHKHKYITDNDIDMKFGPDVIKFFLRGACNPYWTRHHQGRIGEGLPYMDGRREIKYLPRTNMHAASVLIVSGCFYHCFVVR